ncbi:immunity protein YezG family protein [Litoribrevibacter euphylliae]|uniref:Immunity protein YezG family protein n=1 Tax=Litoribrevibacter euphylliae TaxID=1834034 RepID=A0ABV7HMU6_9GAMM
MKALFEKLLSKSKNIEKVSLPKDAESYYKPIAQALADMAPENWATIRVGSKIFEDSAHLTFRCFVGAPPQQKFINYPRAQVQIVENLLKELKQYHIQCNEPWIGCLFEVNNTGKYKVHYFYEDIELSAIADSNT